MGLSDLLNRIKAALGIGGSRRQTHQQPRQQGQHQQGQYQQGQQAHTQQTAGTEAQQEGTSVTVERQPSTGSEDAVKGTETAPETTGGSESESATRESTETAEAEPETPEDRSQEDLGTDESTDVIKGIGSAYAERLADAGVETVADLAASDAESLAEESGISETRLQNWIDRAKHR